MGEKEKTSPRVVGEVTVKVNVDTSELDEAIKKAEKLRAIMDSIKMPKRRNKHPTQEILEHGGIVSGEEFDEMIRDEKIQDAVDERLAEVFGFKPSDPKLLES